MRFSFFILCLLIFQPFGYGQNEFTIEGPRQVFCLGEPQYYFLDFAGQVNDNISWTINPSSGVEWLEQSNEHLVLAFYVSGTYTLIVSSQIGQNFYTDTLNIYVQGTQSAISIEGCYEVNELTNCYQVCAFTSIYVYNADGSTTPFIVEGAESYEDLGGSVHITWGHPGYGSIQTLNSQCHDPICFEILPVPVADFSTAPAIVNDTITICKGEEVFFTNLSQNSIEYLWSFGDGDESTSFHTSHTFVNEGYTAVTLSATGICCESEKQIVIEVLPAPSLVLDCVNSICPGTRQTYTVTTSDCNEHVWSISSNGSIVAGGGISDDFIEIIWGEGPDGFIYLDVDDCATAYCSSTNTFRIPIITSDGPVTGDASVCSGELVTYSAPYYPGVEYAWSVGSYGTIIGDQTNSAVTILWQNVGTTTSSLVAVVFDNCFLECGGQAMLPVSITPKIRITGDDVVCQNEVATIEALSLFSPYSPANVSWSIEREDGFVVHTEPGTSSTFTYVFNLPPGIYQWVATNTSSAYCNDVIKKTIQVVATRSSSFTIEGEREICIGIPYGYTIHSDGDYATYWTVIDGASTNTYEGQSIQHTFGATPPYNITAVQRDIQFDACVSDPITITLNTPKTFVISGPNEACFNGIDSFSVPFISGAEYNWELLPAASGEIRESNKHNAYIFWTGAGNVTIRVTSCGQVVDKNIFVHTLPEFLVVGPVKACPGELVNITTDNPSFQHEWYTESGIIFSSANNVNISPNTYSVEVTDLNGCSDKEAFTISAFPAPVVNLTSTTVTTYCNDIPTGVEIVANTDGTGYVFEWFVDNVSVGIGGPIYTVTAFGTYHVVAINQYGCNVISNQITYIDCCPPTDCGGPGGGLPGSCVYILLDLNMNVINAECPEKQYSSLHPDFISGSATWIIESASQGILAVNNSDVFDYEYALPGYYEVTLLARLDGITYTSPVCGHGFKYIDRVNAVSDFEHIGNCVGEKIVFEDLTTFLPDQSIASWAWNFDDPGSGADNISNVQDPDHTFLLPGTYDVTLTVTMLSGCVTSKTKTITVSDGPILSPVFDPQYCENEAQAFGIIDNVFDIHWDFGDPISGAQDTAGGAGVFHTYINPGFYTVGLTAYNHHGCRSDMNFMVDIKINTLTGLIGIAPGNVICQGDSTTLTSPPGGVAWTWSNGDTTQETQITETNQYSVVVEDQFHCTYSPPAEFIEVIPAPEVVVMGREILPNGEYGPWRDSIHLCQSVEFQIQAFSNSNVTYLWFNGESVSSISFTIEGGNLPGAGVYSYYVIADDFFTTCFSDTVAIHVEIFDLPVIPTISLTSGIGCSHSPNTLTVTNSQPGIVYQWSDGQEGITITTESAGDFYVEAINAQGCNSQSNNLHIKSSTAIDQIPGGCFLKCNPLTLCLPNLQYVDSYNLLLNGVIIQSGTSFPDDVIITADGTYTFEVTTTNGCVVTSDPLTLTLYPGVGSVTVLTYFDVDDNGVISASDTLLPGIPVEIISASGLDAGQSFTDESGEYVFEDFPASEYTVSFDQDLLGSQWQIVIDSVTSEIATCDDSVSVSLLLTTNCFVTGPDQYVEACIGELVAIGDSIFTDTGHYVVHMESALGCDSMFHVIIQEPDTLWIEVQVWVDADGNGIVSAGDTVIEGVTIVFDKMISIDPTTQLTDEFGIASGSFMAVPYQVSIDSTLLPSGLGVIYGLDFISDTDCGDVTFDFLLAPNCANVFTITHEYICEGDSVFIDNQWVISDTMISILLSAPGSVCDTISDIYVHLYPPMSLQTEIAWNCVDFGTAILHTEGIGPFQYEWSHSTLTDSIASLLDNGQYQVTITDVHGCSLYDTLLIDGGPQYSFSIDPLYEIYAGDSVLLFITGDTSVPTIQYQWNAAGILYCAACPSTFAFPVQDTSITITITDESLCEYVLHTNLVLDTLIFDAIYAPNVISPNGDDINDEFTFHSRLPDVFLYEVTILDRWGEIMLHVSDIRLDAFDGWNGMFRGKTMNPQVFTYFARARLSDGQEVKLVGDVTLIR